MADGRRHATALMKVAVLGLPEWTSRLTPRLDPSVAVVGVDPADKPRATQELRDADILVCARFTEQTAAWCHALKLVICPWAGTENIDRAALPGGVELVSSGGTEEPIAEYVMAVLIALRRKLLDADRNLRAGVWSYGFWGGSFVDEVHGSTLGLIGFGRIGHEVVTRAAAFGMRCRALTLHPERASAPAGVACDIGPLAEPSAVDALAAGSDALVLCCELSELTRGLIDVRRLAMMRPNAVIINVARGPIAVERDLYEALRDKRIAGAALDVWYQYPKTAGANAAPSALPFGELDNVIMTPHYSGWTRPALERRIDGIVRAIETFSQRPA